MSAFAHNLGLDGPHQLVKLGAIRLGEDSFNPLIAGCFAPLTVDHGQLTCDSGAQLVLRWIPLGHLMALPLGTGLSTGMRIDVGNLQDYTVKVRPQGNESPLHKRRNLEREGVLQQGNGSDVESNAHLDETLWYEFRSLDTRFDRVLVPCSTLFLAYFAPTSQLATLHVSGGYEEFIEQLRRSGDAYRDEKTGNCRLALDRTHFASEIPSIARTLFDPTGLAGEIASSIPLHFSIQQRKHQPVHLRVEPPFEGVTELEVRGCCYTTDFTGESVLLILHIASCSAEFPWHRLDVTLDQPGRTSGTGEEGGGHRRRKADSDLKSELTEIDAEGQQPGTDFAPVTLIGSSAIRFHALTPDTYNVKRREVNRSGGKRPKADGEKARNSSQRKNSKGDRGARQTGLSNRGDAPEDPSGGEDDGAKRMTPGEALQHTTDELLKASECLPATVRPLLLVPRGLRYREWTLNCVDQTATRTPHWTRILDGALPRGILVARASHNGRNAYVIDIVRRVDESFSIIVLHHPIYSELQHTDLVKTFKRIDEARRLPTDDALTEGLTLRVRRVSHFHSSGPHSLSGVLGKLLTDGGMHASN